MNQKVWLSVANMNILSHKNDHINHVRNRKHFLIFLLHCICVCLPAVALAWRCVSVSCLRTQRVCSCVWPAGTWGGVRLLARPSSPLTPQPRWPCCSWTPAASPPSWLRHRRWNSGERKARMYYIIWIQCLGRASVHSYESCSMLHEAKNDRLLPLCFCIMRPIGQAH